MTFALALSSGAGAGHAADLPGRLVPPVYVPPPAVSTWTGLYVGVNGGYGLDHAPFPYNYSRYFVAWGPGFSAYTERGPLAGAQVGYNMQFRDIPVLGRLPLLNGYSFVDHIVVGVEVDSDWSDINGTATVPTAPALGPANVGVRIKNFGTLRGRTGYAFGPLLLYVHSGLSYATTQSSFSGLGFSASETRTRFPLRPGVYGVGAEYKLSQNWSVRAEYMYDYISVRYPEFISGPNNFGFMSRTSFHVARAALNYHFDLLGSTQVVARY